MKADKRKKISDFMWWLILVALIAWAISTRPGFIFGLALIGAVMFYCYHSPAKSANTNEKEEAIEDIEPYFPTATEKMMENQPKTDSFYSGISEKASIDERPVK